MVGNELLVDKSYEVLLTVIILKLQSQAHFWSLTAFLFASKMSDHVQNVKGSNQVMLLDFIMPPSTAATS